MPPRRLRKPSQKAIETAKQSDMDTSELMMQITESLRVVFQVEIKELKTEQRKQIEALKTEYSKQIEALKTEYSKQIEEIEARLTIRLQEMTINPLSGFSNTYAAVARTPPDSQPNFPSLSSASITPSSMLDKIYCTIDTTRVDKEHRETINLAIIRKTVEQHIQTEEKNKNWNYVKIVGGRWQAIRDVLGVELISSTR